MRKYAAAWFILLLAAFANGTLRQLVYQPYLGESVAHQVSSLTGILLMGVLIWMSVRRWRPRSRRQALGAGCMWLAMTMAFEFLFGHFIAGHPWPELLHDYDLLAGRLWILVLAWIALAPYLVYRRLEQSTLSRR